MRNFLKFLVFLIVVFFIYRSCRKGQENDIAITGKVVASSSYNPIRHDMDYDFAVRVVITNNSSKDLVFDRIDCNWFYDCYPVGDSFVAHYANVYGTPDRKIGDMSYGYTIHPGDSSVEVFTTMGRAGKYDDSVMNCQIILYRIDNKEELTAKIKEMIKNKNIAEMTKNEQIALAKKIEEAADKVHFGPYTSQSFPAMYKLPYASNVLHDFADNECYQLKFVLCDDDFTAEDLAAFRKKHPIVEKIYE